MASSPKQFVRYTGSYYRVILEKGKVYPLLGIESAPFGEGYRVYMPDIEDDGVFPMDVFELVDAPEEEAEL